MLGNTIALLCAVTWSCAVILLKYSGARIDPLALNLVKSLFGLPLLILTAYATEGGVQFPELQDTLLLLASGAIGIGIADGVALRAMRFLGASHIAILECLFSPFVIILSITLFDERPTWLMLLGGLCILASLLFLTPDVEEEGATRKRVTRKELTHGTILMSFAMLTMAFGIVMVKPLFHEVPLISLVTIRMIGGTVAAIILFMVTGSRRERIREVASTPYKIHLLAACFFSSYLSIILWIAGYKYLQATVAALLNQTSTVFTVLLAVIFLKEPFTRGKILATASAIIGVILLTL